MGSRRFYPRKFLDHTHLLEGLLLQRSLDLLSPRPLILLSLSFNLLPVCDVFFKFQSKYVGLDAKWHKAKRGKNNLGPHFLNRPQSIDRLSY